MDIEPELIALVPGERFCFDCSPEVPCFNECCRDLNQFLTPYDIIRLKQHLALTSDRFLARYCSQHVGPETGLPVVTLKPAPGQDHKCPFVSDQGCIVYQDRPSSCRTYPLARMASRNRQTGKITEHFALMLEPHCRGHEQPRAQTLEQWVENQGLARFNAANDQLMEIMALKNRLRPGPLEINQIRLFSLVCYDVDTFRNRINQDLLNCEEPHRSVLQQAAQADDVTLLGAGLVWLKHQFFGTRPAGSE